MFSKLCEIQECKFTVVFFNLEISVSVAQGDGMEATKSKFPLNLLVSPSVTLIWKVEEGGEGVMRGSWTRGRSKEAEDNARCMVHRFGS